MTQGVSMYYFDERIRYSETDRSGLLSLRALLDLFQDCATFHSEDVGLGVAELKRRKTVWVLLTWQVDLTRMPACGEYVRVSTYPYRVKGFMGLRNFLLETREGERLAIANSVWNIVNPDTGRLARMDDDVPARYGAGEPLEMDYAERKIHLPDAAPRPLSPLYVQPHMLDTNGHVNNARYVALAADCLPSSYTYHRLRVEYRHAAHCGDMLSPLLYETPERVVVVLSDGEGQPYAITEFS